MGEKSDVKAAALICGTVADDDEDDDVSFVVVEGFPHAARARPATSTMLAGAAYLRATAM
jgi:hypothetical protein